MRYLLCLFFATTIFMSANAQTFNAHDLNIAWQAVENNYQNKDQSLNALIITNTGKQTMPASGWKLYFNSARDINSATVTGNATINQVNGDLFTITPTATFTEIKPGASERIEFIGDAVINFTDAPEGFYVVWDAEPAKGYAIGGFNVLPFSPKYAGLVTPEVIFNQNKTIADVSEQNLTKVFPTPASYKETGGFFTLTGKVSILADPGFSNEVEGLTTELKTFFGKNLRPASTMDNIYLKHADNMGQEAYTLTVVSDHITIAATTAAGMFYGIQSLKTLIPPSAYTGLQKAIKIPCVEVTDAPRFPYRALSLDVARNFQTKAEVLKLLDAMALYKLNTFHFHLTDDEGWRIEIPSLPELTSVGSQRGHTLDSKNFLPASHGSGPDVGKLAGSGYYTHADYIEILKYATARHIMVVPEIESPGHARAAVKSMNARYAPFNVRRQT